MSDERPDARHGSSEAPPTDERPDVPAGDGTRRVGWSRGVRALWALGFGGFAAVAGASSRPRRTRSRNCS